MRNTFIKSLVELASLDPDIYLIVGDLGFSVVEPFKNKFPDRFINIGICEQNMIGVAAGLAMMGKKVYVYSIIPFVTMRCFEQIRVDLCYQNLPVRLVGVGAGLAYGPSAATHHAIEDVALMRSLPNMTVISPGSNFELPKLIEKTKEVSGPVYFRLSKNEDEIVYPQTTEIEVGKTVEIFSSDQNLILATGDCLKIGFDVCKNLRNLGMDVGLLSVPTIKPLNFDFISSRHKTLNSIFTIEDHNIIGGLYETIASFICKEFNRKILMKPFAIPDLYFHEIGSRDYLRNKIGLSFENINNEIIKQLNFNPKLVKERVYE